MTQLINQCTALNGVDEISRKFKLLSWAAFNHILRANQNKFTVRNIYVLFCDIKLEEMLTVQCGG